jgi:hypothetical protein
MTRLNSQVAACTGEPLAVISRLGFSLLTETRKEPAADDICLVVQCPFCGRQVPYPGRSRDGSYSLAECPDCDVAFEFDDREVLLSSSRPDQASMPAHSRYFPS